MSSESKWEMTGLVFTSGHTRITTTIKCAGLVNRGDYIMGDCNTPCKVLSNERGMICIEGYSDGEPIRIFDGETFPVIDLDSLVLVPEENENGEQKTDFG